MRSAPAEWRIYQAMLRILIVEDHPVVRRGLKDILVEGFPEAVFGEAADAQESLAALDRDRWDIVLLDINMPGRDGLDLLGEARRRWPQVRVLVVSAYPEEEFAVRAFSLGAAGYLGKRQAPDDLLAAVGKVLDGKKYITAALAERLADALVDRETSQTPHAALSPRELQVLRLVARGKAGKEIAAKLALSEKTIATYRARIAEKTGLSTNVEITRYAFQHGLTE